MTPPAARKFSYLCGHCLRLQNHETPQAVIVCPECGWKTDTWTAVAWNDKTWGRAGVIAPRDDRLRCVEREGDEPGVGECRVEQVENGELEHR